MKPSPKRTLMRTLFKNLFVIGLLTTTLACGDDNNDSPAAPPAGPSESQTDSPGDSPEGGSNTFEWATTRFEEDVEECEGTWRFTIEADGSFVSQTCNPEQNKSGNISATDQARVDQALEAISRAEATSSPVCSDLENPAGLKDLTVSMTTESNQRYNLFTRDDGRECYRGTQTEVANLYNLLYELRSIYVNSAL